MGLSRRRRGQDGKPRYTAYHRDLRGRKVSAGTFARKADADAAWQAGDHGAAGPVRLRVGDLAARDAHLVREHRDLRILGGIAPGEQRQPAEQPNLEQLNEANEHRRRA